MIKTVGLSEEFKKSFVEKMDDSNDEKDIQKAGIFDIMDALSGTDNSKFSVEEAQKEMERRGL